MMLNKIVSQKTPLIILTFFFLLVGCRREGSLVGNNNWTFGNDRPGQYAPGFEMSNCYGGSDCDRGTRPRTCFGTSCDTHNAENPDFDPNYTQIKEFWNGIQNFFRTESNEEPSDSQYEGNPYVDSNLSISPQEQVRIEKYSSTALSDVDEINQANAELDEKIRRLNELKRQADEINKEVKSRTTEVTNEINNSVEISSGNLNDAQINSILDRAVVTHDTESNDVARVLVVESNTNIPVVYLTDPNSIDGKKIRSAHEYSERIEKYAKSIPQNSEVRKMADSALSVGRIAIRYADERYAAGDKEKGDAYLEIALQILDGVVGFVPGVGLGQDLWAVTTGHNLITGEKLSKFEYTMAVIGVATAGYGSKIAKVYDTLEVLKKVSKEVNVGLDAADAVHDAEKIVDSAKNWDNVQSLIHVAKGNYKIAADGTRKIVSGMHTKLGFDNFLKLNRQAGKNYNIRNVIEFTAERIEAGGDILSQTLGNGVRRVQLPRDAWANGDSFNKALAYTESGQKLKGAKSLFPESWDVAKIGEATSSVKSSASSTRQGASISGTFDGVSIKLFVDESDRILTAFPTWRQ